MLDHSMRYKLQFLPQMIIDLDHFSEDEIFDKKTKKEKEDSDNRNQSAIKDGININRTFDYNTLQDVNKSQFDRSQT